jgi:hypothetical protein
LDKSFIQANIKKLKDLSYNVYIITPGYVRRLDLISYQLYNTVKLKWILIYVNDIVDLSVLEYGYKLKYPGMKDILKTLSETVDYVLE